MPRWGLLGPAVQIGPNHFVAPKQHFSWIVKGFCFLGGSFCLNGSITFPIPSLVVYPPVSREQKPASAYLADIAFVLDRSTEYADTISDSRGIGTARARQTQLYHA